MDLIWDKMWSVGVDKIDRQHKELFNRINLLVCSMKSAKGKEEMITTLNFLEEYVIRHFNDEEKFKRKIIILIMRFSIKNMKFLKII
jgi:Hemerythrin